MLSGKLGQITKASGTNDRTGGTFVPLVKIPVRASDSPATYGALQMCFDLIWFVPLVTQLKYALRSRHAINGARLWARLRNIGLRRRTFTVSASVSVLNDNGLQHRKSRVHSRCCLDRSVAYPHSSIVSVQQWIDVGDLFLHRHSLSSVLGAKSRRRFTRTIPK